MEKNKKKILLLSCIFVAAAAILGAAYFALRPDGEEGTKQFTLEVILTDGSSTSHQIKTEEEYVGAALLEEGLIAGHAGEYGLFITTVNGVTADDAKQEWWCFTINGEVSMYGIDLVPATDGGHYELTLTVGWQ